MRDWKAGVPACDLDRIAAPLDALEAAFRSLVKDLPPDLEPALELGAEEEGE